MTALTSIEFLDWCRWFIIAQACLVIVTLVVMWFSYALRVTREPSQPHVWHIIAISASYIGAVVYVAITTLGRFGMEFTWRIPLSAFIFISADFAICFILAHIYSHRFYENAAKALLILKETEIAKEKQKG